MLLTPAVRNFVCKNGQATQKKRRSTQQREERGERERDRAALCGERESRDERENTTHANTEIYDK
jgi:hypothetical protein